MKDPRDIIIQPVVSEKSYGLIEQDVYTFSTLTPQIASMASWISGLVASTCTWKV